MKDWDKVISYKNLNEENLFDQNGISVQFNREDFYNCNMQPKSLIPIYSNQSLKTKFISGRTDIFPVRNGKGACVLINHNLIKNLELLKPQFEIKLNTKTPPEILQIDRDYLNKVLNSKIINHLLDEPEGNFLLRGLEGKRYIDSNSKLKFKGNEIPILDKIQFEIDLGLETEETIYAIEAKQATVSTEVSLLQAIYPVIFLKGINVKKKIRAKVLVFNHQQDFLMATVYNVDYDETDPFEITKYQIGKSQSALIQFI